MVRFRRRLPSIAAFWLSCHAALLTAPSIAFMAAPAALVECTCTHGEHAVCPMHHRPAADSRICLIRSTDQASTGVVASIFTFVGILATSAPSIASPQLRGAPSVDVTSPRLASSPPEAPPPRA